MNRPGRGTRRSDDWASPHERARTRAAQRLDWPLDPDEAAWLDGHLVECVSCSALANDYVDIRNRLRALRSVTPPPPRDLWARTAAAIEQESHRRQRARRAPTVRVPIGALSGVLVIAVVLGATLLSNLPGSPDVVTPERSVDVAVASPDAVPTAGSTPIVVGAGDVRVVRWAQDGTYGYSRLGVDEVCPADGELKCPLVRDDNSTALAFRAEPQTIIASPNENRAVVVGAANGTKANDVIVMSLPTADPTAIPSESPGPSESPAVTEPPASPTESLDVTMSPEPASPSVAPPSEGPSETPTIEPSGEPATPSPTPDLTADPSPTPEEIAIASDLIVVGQTAAFSPDGRWFAFTGRPVDDSTGPDIFVWQVGDAEARPVTTDHRSVFASWADGRLVGSRPATALADGVEVAAEAFLLDPATGVETILAMAGWQPVVAPAGDRALVFTGTVSAANEGRDIAPSSGTLELRSWDETQGGADEDATIVLDVSHSSFDARWDETGTSFAIWVQDSADPSFGRLSLFFVDPDTGEIEQPANAPRDEPALPGFSIGAGRLAWASPAGQDGEGSRVQIVAWSEGSVGTAESAPGDQVVVVR